jgi:circadian clock protein KaiB
MPNNRPGNGSRITAGAWKRLLAGRGPERFVFTLYITGHTPRSLRAVERVRALCERHLAGRYELRAIDLYLHPECASQAQVLVAPTLVKEQPSPQRFFIGDMSDENRILRGLNLSAQ